MAIASVEVIPYALPVKEPYVTARGTLERREMVLLRVRDEEGVEGLGEAVPLSLRGGATLVDVVAELRAFGERISGRPDLDHVRISGMASAMLSDPGSCAVQVALLDLAGKQSGDSRADRDSIACNATLTAGAPDRVADQAARWAEDGFSTFKLKVGVDGDVEQVGAVRSILGPEARIRVDANGVWEPSRAGQ